MLVSGSEPSCRLLAVRDDANTRIGTTRQRRLPLLMYRDDGYGTTSTPVAVDGRDVGAAVRDGLRVRRAARRFPVLNVPTGARAGANPVAVLASRMFADHQLDGNGLLRSTPASLHGSIRSSRLEGSRNQSAEKRTYADSPTPVAGVGG